MKNNQKNQNQQIAFVILEIENHMKNGSGKSPSDFLLVKFRRTSVPILTIKNLHQIR
jgi:hypothetical protein